MKYCFFGYWAFSFDSSLLIFNFQCLSISVFCQSKVPFNIKNLLQIKEIFDYFIIRNFRGKKISRFRDFFAKFRNLIPANIKTFCHRKTSYRKFLKFFGQRRNSNFENLEILMNGMSIKYGNSLMKGKKSNRSRLNSLLLPWNQFMRNGLLISIITGPYPKRSKLFKVAGALQGSQIHWKVERLVWNNWACLLILNHY